MLLKRRSNTHLRIAAHIAAVLVFATGPQKAAADSAHPVFEGMWENTVDSFKGPNLIFHAAGVLSTSALIRSGYDAHVYGSFRHNYNDAAVPGAVLGTGVGAVVAGTWLYRSGREENDKESIGAAFVIAQASVITVSYVALLKVTTGRAHPTNSWHLSPQEQSEQFQFGFLRNGLTAYGWPSGHVSHTVAVTSALAHYYPHKPWLAWLSAGLSSYMLYSVSSFNSGQMHWFSDGVAGAFMGYAIGSTVGKNFRRRLDGSASEAASSAMWMPLVGAGYIGATAAVWF